MALVPNGHFLLGQLRSEGRFGKGTGTPLVVGGIWKDLPGTERELRLLQTTVWRQGPRPGWTSS